MEKSSKSLWAEKRAEDRLRTDTARALANAFLGQKQSLGFLCPNVSRLTLAMACEDTGGDAADVLLSDTGVVHLRPQARHGEDMDITQVGEAGKAGLSVVLRYHTGKGR